MTDQEFQSLEEQLEAVENVTLMEALNEVHRLKEQLETYRSALERIAALSPFKPPSENGTGVAHHIARAALYPAKRPT